MKVLHFYKTFFPETYGGVEQVIDQLAQGMEQYGVESNVLTISKSQKLGNSVINGYKVHRSKSSLSLASTEFSIPAIKDFYNLAKKADIIHYQFPYPFADLLHFITKVNKPTVVSYQSDIVKQKNLLRIYKPLMYRFLNSVDKIIATSDNYLNTSEVLQKYKDKVTVIPNAINKASYPLVDSTKINHWKEKLGDKFFLFIGVPRYYKGLYSLINAAKNSNFKVVIAGSGGIDQELKDYTQKNQINNVIFLGSVSEEDKVALLNICYSVVLPSQLRSEAFGMVLLEGAMYAKPLISCEIGTGTTFINKDRITGLVAKPDNYLDLKDKMDYLFNNPDIAKAMGAKAFERYNNIFTIEKMSKDYYSVYQELLNKNNK